jgi:flagellar assembly protein FliH
MGLIKSSKVPPSAVPFSMKDIEGQARTLLLRAKEKAEQILAEAQAEGQTLRAQEKSLGFAEGRAEGLARGELEGQAAGAQQALEEHRASLTQLVTALNSATQQIEQSRRQLEEQAVGEVMKLAIAIAGRVTKRQGALDPTVLTENIVAAMKLAVHSTDLRIAVHPTQKQYLADALPKLSLEWPNLQHVELAEDAGLAPGGCRIFSGSGVLDADLDEQLTRIAADLLPSPAVAGGGA